MHTRASGVSTQGPACAECAERDVSPHRAPALHKAPRVSTGFTHTARMAESDVSHTCGARAFSCSHTPFSRSLCLTAHTLTCLSCGARLSWRLPPTWRAQSQRTRSRCCCPIRCTRTASCRRTAWACPSSRPRSGCSRPSTAAPPSWATRDPATCRGARPSASRCERSSRPVCVCANERAPARL
eukprot:6691601-Prymnesium_polylepis.1